MLLKKVLPVTLALLVSLVGTASAVEASSASKTRELVIAVSPQHRTKCIMRQRAQAVAKEWCQ